MTMLSWWRSGASAAPFDPIKAKTPGIFSSLDLTAFDVEVDSEDVWRVDEVTYAILAYVAEIKQQTEAGE